MANGITPAPFVTGYRLTEGNQLNTNFGHPIISSQDAVTAHAGGTQAAAYQLTTRITRLSAVATAADSVKLQANPAGKIVVIINDTAVSATVYGFGTDTINGAVTATGVPLPAGTVGVYYGVLSTVGGAGKWFATFDAVSTLGTFAIPTANKGTFTATGSAVTITNANITANSVVTFGLKTVGGTIAGAPYMTTVTAGTSFTVNAGASDTSVYNYAIIG